MISAISPDKTKKPPFCPPLGGRTDTKKLPPKGGQEGGYHQQSRDAGRDVVRYVVDACRPASEVLIAFRTVAYHRVERVHHLVGHHAWHTSHCQPEQRGYHSVAQILGQCLQGSCTNLLCRQFRGVAPHDSSHLPASVVYRTVNGMEHLTNLTNQRGTGQTTENQQR